MSVPDNELWWWKEENRPDGVHCDRNGCVNLGTRQVEWQHLMEPSTQGVPEPRLRRMLRRLACSGHADWWIQRSGALVTGWTPK